MEQTTNALAVFITAPNSDEAKQLADLLVERRLAACVQILPEIKSVYRWQGKIEQQPEILLIVKTTQSKFEALEKEVRARHSYETPEIAAFELTAVSAPYLEWLAASVGVDESS